MSIFVVSDWGVASGWIMFEWRLSRVSRLYERHDGDLSMLGRGECYVAVQSYSYHFGEEWIRSQRLCFFIKFYLSFIFRKFAKVLLQNRGLKNLYLYMVNVNWEKNEEIDTEI